VFHEVVGRKAMGTQDWKAGKIGSVGERLDVQGERWSEGGDGAVGVTEEETVGVYGIGCEEQAALRDVFEVVTAFELGWAGVAETSGTVTNEDAGDVAFDHALVEVGEQTAEPLSSQALFRREQAHEVIKDHKTGIDLFNGMGEAGKVWRRG
jgi:hypothetical protein